MKSRKEYLIIIIFTVILIGIILTIAFFALFKEEETEVPFTTPTSTHQQKSIDIPTRTNETKTNPPVQYSAEATERMLDKLKNKIPLSASDVLAKQKILTLLPAGQVSGVVYRSPTVIIDYTKTADGFQGEILTVDVAQAKKDAAAWFRSQGLSQKAICDMPVVFYLNHTVANQLRGTGFQLNPLAEGC